MKKKLSYCLRALLLSFIVLLSAVNTYASHIVGMDLFYTYVSGSTYKITVIAFGDCGPASAGAFATLPTSSPTICIYDGSTYETSISLTIQAPDDGVEITPVCPGVATQCTSATSTIPGITKFIYTGLYTVPHTSAVWRFVYTGDMGTGSAAGRAAAITNILAGTNTQLVDTLNNTAHHNSNPVLTVVPTPFFCLNNNDGYNPGAVDPDGDSLSFFLVPGINGATTCSPGTTVTYTGTFSGAAPLGVSPGSFSLNPLTGQILFFPNIIQRALVVYNIEEYRDDTLIGSCQREMTFLVQTCTNPPPGGVLSSASAGTLVDSTDFKICAGTGAYTILMNPHEPDVANNITVTASGLPAGATFTTVNNGTNHPNCTFSWTTAGIASGTYVFYVTFTDNNCPINGSETRSYTINVLPLPVIHASGAETFCLGASSATLGATGGVSYTWSPGAGLSCTSCTSPVSSPAATTLYTVTGESANGCTSTDTVRVTVNPLPTITVSPAATICTGSSTTLTTSGGTSYSWSPGTGLSCTTCTSPVASPAATTAYSVTGTGANGCQNRNTTTITVDVPAINAGPSASLCPGASATLSATGGVSYLWSPGTGLSCTTCSSPVSNPAATTTYTLSGTDAAGCHGTDTVIITRLSVLTITVPPIAICAGLSGTFTASGASLYTWSPATGLSCTNCSSPVANPAANTTYTITGTNGTCMGTTTTSVTVNPLPVITASGAATRCVGDADVLSATGGATYTWSPGTGLSCASCTSPMATPGATTSYTVTGTAGTGCQSTDSVTVTINPLPVINAGAPVSLCVGGSTTLTPSGGLTYVWSPGTGLSCTSCPSPVASPPATTIYTVTGTDVNGCHNTAPVTITRLAAVVTTVPAIAICSGASGTVVASGATTYTWSPATSLSCTACPNPSASPSATATYTVAGVIGFCSDTTTVTITVNPLPVITVTGATTKCVGDPATFSAAGGLTYSWLPSTGLSCFTCSTPAATPAATTTYTVTGYNSFGCPGADSLTLTINPLPVLTATPATLCYGDSAVLTAGGAVTYSWSPAEWLTPGATGTSVTTTPDSTITYTVTGTDANHCNNTITDLVVVNPIPPAPAVVSPVSYCENVASVPLIATGTDPGSVLQWYTTASESGTAITAAPAPPTSVAGITTWYVSQTVNGCQGPLAPISVNIFVNAITAFSLDIKYGCNFDTLTLVNNSQNVSSYLWSFGDGTFDTAATPVHYYYAVLQPTTYIIKLDGYIPSCYSDSTSDTITLLPSPTPFTLTNVTPNQTINYGSSVQLNADGAYVYYWIPNDGTLNNPNINNPIATPTADTTYKVYAYNRVGCVDSAEVHIDVITDHESIPDAFTPNGDGHNDIFHVVNLGYGKLIDFRIYNRWGQLVCQTTDNNKGWDGKFNGVPQDMDVYNYMIIVGHADGKTQVYKGNLTLLR